jgi:hypothetical protein
MPKRENKEQALTRLGEALRAGAAKLYPLTEKERAEIRAAARRKRQINLDSGLDKERDRER